ncbi:MAG TPA: glycoside hydrolase family 25 protein [Candidatus Sulfotelmatobacter sp.]|nr:glycoside hydrolase family 25 protein [Candidatus Sulfotelmatobacter sp.]
MSGVSRRQVVMGLAALGLSGCASAPPRRVEAPASYAPAVIARRKATTGPVSNPSDVGLDGVIDLNHHSSIMDFGMARQYGGLKAVIHKASEGNDWFDPLYAQRRVMAEEAGLLWGGYHFGTRMHSGAEQARAFLAAAQPGPQTLLVLDLELNERVPTNSMTLPQAEEFAATVMAVTGRLPLLYVQPAWADGETHRRTGQSLCGAIAPGSLLSGCDLWLADYRMEPELPAAWAGRGWRFWQYAGDNGAGGSGPFGPLSRAMPGVDRCDRNVFSGDETGLGRYWARS